MQPRIHAFFQAFRSSGVWVKYGSPGFKRRISPFVCRTCQSNFSTSTFWRQAVESLKKEASGVTKEANHGFKTPSNNVNTPKNRYDENFVIYDAGDIRTAWLAFWKGTAIFQFGVVCVFFAPILYHNEKQPDANVRLLQAGGVILLSTIPVAALSYLTSPFVKTIYLRLPGIARTGRPALLRWTQNLPANTEIEFTTLRAFPFKRNTAVLLKELRALSPQSWRFANLERVKGPEWRKEQAQKAWWERFLGVLNEPRFKFYVKEGRMYTQKTGVPEVWENVAQAIQKQSVFKGGEAGRDAARAPKLMKNPSPVKNVRRQTTRR